MFLNIPETVWLKLIDYIGFPGLCKLREINNTLRDKIDYDIQFDKSFVEPLKFITDKILWRIDNSYGTQGTLEDFF